MGRFSPKVLNWRPGPLCGRVGIWNFFLKGVLKSLLNRKAALTLKEKEVTDLRKIKEETWDWLEARRKEGNGGIIF